MRAAWLGSSALIALSSVVITGYVGQISLAQFAFAGFAAFMTAKIADDLGVPFPFAPLLAIALRGLDVRALDEARGRAAGELLARSGSSDVIDARSDSFLWISLAVKPGVSVGTTKPRMPSSVRAQMMAMSAIVPFESYMIPLYLQLIDIGWINSGIMSCWS